MISRAVAFGDQVTSVAANGELAEELVELACRHLDGAPAVVSPAALTVDSTGGDGARLTLASPTERLLSTGSPGALLDRLVFELSVWLVDQSRAGVHVHGALVVRDGRAVVLPGQSGAGKSTLTAWLVRRGWLHATDELTYVALGSLEASGLGRPIHLKPGSKAVADAFGLVAGRDCVRSEVGDFVQPEALGGRRHRGTATLAGVAFVRWDPSSAEASQPLSRASAAFALRQCVPNARNLARDGLDEVARLARSVPAIELTYSSFEHAERVLADLVRR